MCTIKVNFVENNAVFSTVFITARTLYNALALINNAYNKHCNKCVVSLFANNSCSVTATNYSYVHTIIT